MLNGLTGCMTPTVAPIKSFCLIYRPVTTSTKDTAETVSQVDSNNRAYTCDCLHNCPPSAPKPAS